MSKSNDMLYHYTNLNGLIGILETKKIWATHFLFLNDLEELNYSMDLIDECLKTNNRIVSQDFRNTFNDLFTGDQVPDIYLCSFSNNGDQLSQWRGYCIPSGGFSIGFDKKEIELISKEQGFNFRYCEYNKIRQKKIIQQLIDKYIKRAERRINNSKVDLDSEIRSIASDRLNFAFEILDIAPFIKHNAFEEENEWRTVFYNNKDHKDKHIFIRKNQSMAIPYIELDLCKDKNNTIPIRKIIIGPTSNKHLSRKSVEIAAKKYQLDRCDIVSSIIPYRASL